MPVLVEGFKDGSIAEPEEIKPCFSTDLIWGPRWHYEDVTVLDVVVRDVDPAEEEVPTVLFPAKDAET